jgi:N-acetylglucosaminyldiphosphoundecaprenol N-acetyl-beta-D-mannosaminyltransferase
VTAWASLTAMIDLGKRNVFGVLVTACDYEAATEKVLAAAAVPHALSVTSLAVHGLVTAVRDPAFAARVNTFDLVTPDGQPVRWALNDLHGVHLAARVNGLGLMRRVLAGCAARGLPVYFYGTHPETLTQVVEHAVERHPGLVIAGSEPSRFGTVGPEDLDAIAKDIRASGARVLFVGTGCPRQEILTHAIHHRVNMPTLAVGAAFDYIAGTLHEPPEWMARIGLEWAVRLSQEPRRLWRRYLTTNPYFLYAWVRSKWQPKRNIEALTFGANEEASAYADEAIPA